MKGGMEETELRRNGRPLHDGRSSLSLGNDSENTLYLRLIH